MKKNRLIELDSLRGIAALLVVLFHFTLYREQAKYGFRFGVTGVDLFFIISGFVILLTLEKTKSWKDFVISRFSRLYPAYWVCVTFTTIAILLYSLSGSPAIRQYFEKNPAPGAAVFIANLSMVQYYFRINDIDGPYWTLLIEMLFYLTMTLIFLTGKLKQIELIAALSLIVITVYATYLNNIFPPGYKLLRYGFPLVNYFPLFCAGIVFYKIKFSGASLLRYCLVAVCFFIQVALFDDGVRSMGFINRTEYCFALLIYFGLFVLYVNNRLSFIVNPVTVFLGGISYSLYLIHQFISITVIIPLLVDRYHINFWVTALLIDLPVVLLVATLINRYIEKPAMKFIRDKYKKRLYRATPGNDGEELVAKKPDIAVRTEEISIQ
jgi:peptidoglycan/LPS O-acetylase OafA/YrhL